MTIFRVQKKEHFVVLDKGFLMNPSLSWQAKGLLAYMLSLPNDWCFNIGDLKNRSKNGRDATNNAMNELIEKQYIIRHRNMENGKFGKTELFVYEIPQTENPYTENPAPENPTLLNNKILNNKHVEQLDDVQVIIEYLNAKAGTHFKHTTKSTKSLLAARLADGFTVADCQRVIDCKLAQWQGTEMAKYLRPSTLFNASKFEGYLNEASAPRQAPSVATPPLLDFQAGEDTF